jgi:hypothetical protein
VLEEIQVAQPLDLRVVHWVLTGEPGVGEPWKHSVGVVGMTFSRNIPPDFIALTSKEQLLTTLEGIGDARL